MYAYVLIMVMLSMIIIWFIVSLILCLLGACNDSS